MTDRIDPARLRRDSDYIHTDPPPARKAVSQPLAHPGDLPDASFGPLPRVRTDVSVQRVAFQPSPVQSGLDAFFARATPTFLVEGRQVQVPMPFRMTVDVTTPSSEWRDQELRAVIPHYNELRAAAASVGLGDSRHLGLLRSGRATPEDVQKVTQALIDRDRLPSQDGDTPASRVRKMMFDYGLGLDCASYTQQAFLASRGECRGQTRLNPEIANEDLTHLEREGFRRVPIDGARPGDILVLDAPPAQKGEPGHTLIVYDRREATSEELKQLRQVDGFRTGHVTAYVLDSSYGSSSTFDQGGVMRQLWWRDDDTKYWARGDLSDVTKVERWPPYRNRAGGYEERPYVGGHVVHGVYRPAGETP